MKPTAETSSGSDKRFNAEGSLYLKAKSPFITGSKSGYRLSTILIFALCRRGGIGRRAGPKTQAARAAGSTLRRAGIIDTSFVPVRLMYRFYPIYWLKINWLTKKPLKFSKYLE